MTYWKVVCADGRSPLNRSDLTYFLGLHRPFNWSLPSDDEPGQWHEDIPSGLIHGLHFAASLDDLGYWWLPGLRVFEADVSGPVARRALRATHPHRRSFPDATEIVASRARLVREHQAPAYMVRAGNFATSIEHVPFLRPNNPDPSWVICERESLDEAYSDAMESLESMGVGEDVSITRAAESADKAAMQHGRIAAYDSLVAHLSGSMAHERVQYGIRTFQSKRALTDLKDALIESEEAHKVLLNNPPVSLVRDGAPGRTTRMISAEWDRAESLALDAYATLHELSSGGLPYQAAMRASECAILECRMRMLDDVDGVPANLRDLSRELWTVWERGYLVAGVAGDKIVCYGLHEDVLG